MMGLTDGFISFIVWFVFPLVAILAIGTYFGIVRWS